MRLVGLFAVEDDRRFCFANVSPFIRWTLKGVGRDSRVHDDLSIIALLNHLRSNSAGLRRSSLRLSVFFFCRERRAFISRKKCRLNYHRGATINGHRKPAVPRGLPACCNSECKNLESCVGERFPQARLCRPQNRRKTQKFFDNFIDSKNWGRP